MKSHPPASTLEPTKFADRYEVLGTLGEGGMGLVYKVRDLELDEEVALKVLHQFYAETEGALDRFRREVKLARRVTHPNVARTYDLGCADGVRFLTMELIVGPSVGDRMQAARKMPLGDALRIASETARGLAAAHAVGVVHRDLKPDNLLLDVGGLTQRGERVVITDFGIAVLAQGAPGGGARSTESIIGTPEYMAPEQVEGKDLDGRADVYAVGIMLFEMLTGRLPFEGPTPYVIAAARLTQEAADIRSLEGSVPAAVSALVGRMLKRARDERPDALALVDALDALRGAARPAVVTTAEAQPPVSQRGLPRAVITVVIAPFAASDPEAAALATDIADAAGDALASSTNFRVVPAAASGTAAKTEEVAALGRRFGAKLVVDGSVRIAGERTRARVRVVDVETEQQVWGNHFDGTLAAALELEDATCQAVVDAVNAIFTTAPTGEIEAEGPMAPAARSLYERGVEGAREFGDHLEQALELLRQANEAAPDDPFVMSALGAALVRSWSFKSDAVLLNEAEDWSLRALATGTRIGQTFNTIGILRLHQGELRAAVGAFREATSRSPNLSEPHSYLGRLASESGLIEIARRHLERAVELDPGDHHALSELARMAGMGGRWERADALLERASVGRTEPIVRATRARFMVWRKDRAKLGELVAWIDARSDDPALRIVVRLLLPIWKAIAAGQTLALDDERLTALRDAAEGTSMRLTMFWYQLLAETCGVAGHLDQALSAVEAAASRTLIDVSWIDRCPAIDSLRSDARLSRARAVVAARAASLWR